MQQQKVVDDKGRLLLAQVAVSSNTCRKDMEVAKETHATCRVVEEQDDEVLEEAWGDVSGAQFDPKEVKKARVEEV